MTPTCFAAQIALREMGNSPSLLVALDYLALLAELKPERFPAAAVRWHGRLELEAPTLTRAESQFALVVLAAMGEGESGAVGVLRSLVRKARPTLMPPVV